MSKSSLATLIKSAQTWTIRHSPELLTGAGIAGMVTTVVLAVRATPKAIALIEEEKKKKDVDKLTPLDTVKTCWKCYIPAAVSGTTSMVCLIGANSVSMRRHAALATAYKLSEAAYAEYRETVAETIGEKKEEAVRDKVNQKQLEKVPVSKNEVYVTGKGNTLCLDPLSKRYFRSDIDRIRKVENTLNKRMLHSICGSVSLSEFYDELGLDRTDISDSLGWNTDVLINLHITPGLTEEDEPCLVIGHDNLPTYNF